MATEFFSRSSPRLSAFICELSPLTWRFSLLTLGSYLVALALMVVLLAPTESLPSEEPADVVPISFSGQRAYARLGQLVTRFPNRVTGSAADEGAAMWVADRFRALGMDVEEQRFAVWGYFLERPGEAGRYHGVNIVGTHRGEVQDSIVFGAHRDVVPTTYHGANDNGSGTAVLLELARVLTRSPHHHTYVFVSFGAEEVGMGGARYYVHHSYPMGEMKRVKLMVDLDTLGWAEAWSHRVASWEYMPPRATALLHAMARRDSSFHIVPSKALPRVAGLLDDSNSDSAPFVLRGTPALYMSDGRTAPFVHTPADTVDQVAPAALEKAGRFVEEFVRRVDRGGHLEGPRRFLVSEGGVVPPWQTALLPWVAMGFAIAQVALAWGEARAKGMAVVAILWEQRWLGLAALGSAGGVASFLPLAMGWTGPSIVLLGVWVALVLALVIVLARLRQRTPAAPPHVERVALRGFFALQFAGMAMVAGGLLATVLMAPHLALGTRAALLPGRRWRLLDGAVLGVPAVMSGLMLLAGGLAALADFFPRGRLLLWLALAYLGWVLPLVYGLRRGYQEAPDPRPLNPARVQASSAPAPQ